VWDSGSDALWLCRIDSLFGRVGYERTLSVAPQMTSQSVQYSAREGPAELPEWREQPAVGLAGRVSAGADPAVFARRFRWKSCLPVTETRHWGGLAPVTRRTHV
jgi:hypothetical protein